MDPDNRFPLIESRTESSGGCVAFQGMYEVLVNLCAAYRDLRVPVAVSLDQIVLRYQSRE